MNRKEPETCFSSDKKDYRILVLLVAGILIISISFVNRLFDRNASAIPPELQLLSTTSDEARSQIIRSLLFLPVQINSADQHLIQTVPGIGPKLSTRIIALREERNGFHDLAELLEVEGIGPGKFNRIQKYCSL